MTRRKHMMLLPGGFMFQGWDEADARVVVRVEYMQGRSDAKIMKHAKNCGGRGTCKTKCLQSVSMDGLSVKSIYC